MIFTAKVWCRQAEYRRLNLVEAVSYTGSRYPGRGGSGGAEAKEEKARSCTIARAPDSRILYGRLHRPKASHFPWLYIP